MVSVFTPVRQPAWLFTDYIVECDLNGLALGFKLCGGVSCVVTLSNSGMSSCDITVDYFSRSGRRKHKRRPIAPPLLSLPTELLQEISCYLTPFSLAHFSRTCRALSCVCIIESGFYDLGSRAKPWMKSVLWSPRVPYITYLRIHCTSSPNDVGSCLSYSNGLSVSPPS
jgi:hypothetical protein